MSYCFKCGKEIKEGAAFCVECGTPVEQEIPVALEQPEVIVASAPSQSFDEGLGRVEYEFLENTQRLLRWEHKAWSIASKAFIISGIVFAGFFSLYILIGMIVALTGESMGVAFIGIGFVYAVFLGGMFIALGIVSKKAAEKIPQYIDTVFTDFSLAYNRCGNIGMLIFNVLLGVVSPIFFIINFVRIKSNKELIERIIRNQRS